MKFVKQNLLFGNWEGATILTIVTLVCMLLDLHVHVE